MDIQNLDCFEFFENYEGDKIDCVIVDLPYGQTACHWDCAIDLKKMWENLFRICRRNTIFCFFATSRFGNTLINSKPNYFKYDLVWEKINSVGFLSAKKMPLRKHEMIYIFGNSCINDTKREYNKDLREYSKNLFEWINKSKNEIFNKQGHGGLDHFTRWNTLQFGIPQNKNYQFLIDEYKINEFKDFIEFKELKRIWNLDNKPIYNPIMTYGHKHYAIKEGKYNVDNVYGNKKNSATNNKGSRYPTSILKFGSDKEKLHSTQKPVALCEWLIKTYSNENGLVLDFCMGSGSTGVACINTNRRFIGIEKDEKIFKIAKKRLNL